MILKQGDHMLSLGKQIKISIENKYFPKRGVVCESALFTMCIIQGRFIKLKMIIKIRFTTTLSHELKVLLPSMICFYLKIDMIQEFKYATK